MHVLHMRVFFIAETNIESVFIEPVEVVNHTLTGKQLVEYLINWKTKVDK